jgi:uroporphyrinogen decarboxylase
VTDKPTQKPTAGKVLPRERVLTALRFEQPDICPYYIWIHEEMTEPLSQHYGVRDVKATVIRDHQVMREILALKEYTTPDTYLDDFGSLWRQGAVLHVERPALAAPSLRGYTFPDLSSDAHFAGLAEWLDAYRDRFKIVQLGMLFFERTWAMRGMENIMMDMHENPRFVDELLDSLESLCCSVIDRLVRDFRDHVDAIRYSDDMGAQHVDQPCYVASLPLTAPETAPGAHVRPHPRRGQWCTCISVAMSSRSWVSWQTWA